MPLAQRPIRIAAGPFGFLLALTASFTVACSQPDPLVFCHNANCAGPPNPSRDDTLEALSESLALTLHGRPVIDGVELDVFWHGSAAKCLFAHDLEAPAPAPAMDAAHEVASHVERHGSVSWNGERFYLLLELKGFVGSSFRDEHSAAQADAHAGCALDMANVVRDAAERSDRRVEIIFDSSAPAVLRALTAHARWPGPQLGTHVWLRLSADFVDSTPSGLAFQKLSEFPRVDNVVFHAGWVNDGHYQAFRSLDVDLTLWMFSATAETFDAVRRLEPDAVLTSEAPLMRRWIEK